MLVADFFLILPFCKDTKFVLQNIRLFIVLLLAALSVPLLAQEPDSLLLPPPVAMDLDSLSAKIDSLAAVSDSLSWRGDTRDTL